LRNIYIIAGVWRKKWGKYALTEVSNLLETRLKKLYIRYTAFTFYYMAEQKE